MKNINVFPRSLFRLKRNKYCRKFQTDQLKLHLKYVGYVYVPTLSYFNKVVCIRGMWVGYFIFQYIHAIIAIAPQALVSYIFFHTTNGKQAPVDSTSP